jgi:hypothetical protein
MFLKNKNKSKKITLVLLTAIFALSFFVFWATPANAASYQFVKFQWKDASHTDINFIYKQDGVSNTAVLTQDYQYPPCACPDGNYTDDGCKDNAISQRMCSGETGDTLRSYKVHGDARWDKRAMLFKASMTNGKASYDYSGNGMWWLKDPGYTFNTGNGVSGTPDSVVNLFTPGSTTGEWETFVKAIASGETVEAAVGEAPPGAPPTGSVKNCTKSPGLKHVVFRNDGSSIIHFYVDENCNLKSKILAKEDTNITGIKTSSGSLFHDSCGGTNTDTYSIAGATGGELAMFERISTTDVNPTEKMKGLMGVFTPTGANLTSIAAKNCDASLDETTSSSDTYISFLISLAKTPGFFFEVGDYAANEVFDMTALKAKQTAFTNTLSSDQKTKTPLAYTQGETVRACGPYTAEVCKAGTGGVPTPVQGPRLANPDGTCTENKYEGDVTQLMDPLPGAIMCFAERGILDFLQSIFTGIGDLFKDVLLVNTNSAGKTSLLSTNEVVIAVSNIFVNFINSLFFIVALLSILVTTLKIDLPALSLNSWQLKRMIPTIITTMILVNYSLSVANLVIGIMDSLVGQFSSIDAGQFFNFGADMWAIKDIAWGIIGFRIIFLFVFLFVVLYLLCVLWVRKIVLIVLYMFAPVPYLANIIPVEAIKKQTGKWWGLFMNWGLMGPMVAVFLFAAAKSIQVSFDAVPLPSSVTGSVPSGGLSFTNMILVSVLLYMAATLPLKMGEGIMAAVQKQTTAKAGKAAGAVAKSAKEGAVKMGKTAAYNAAAGKGLGKIPGVRGLVSGAITAGRMPAMFKAKADAKLGAAKGAADDALDKGKITQRMKSNPLVKDEVDKARDKNMALAPQQVMDNAVKAMNDGNSDKVAGAFKALQDQSKSLDPKVSQAANEQITQLKNATGIDLATAKPDLATVQTAIKFAQNSANSASVANLKRGFLKGSDDQVRGDLAGATTADTIRLGSLDKGLSDMEISNLESKQLPDLTYNTSDAGIEDQIRSNSAFATRTPAEITSAATALKIGDTATAATALGISSTDTVNNKVLGNLQTKIKESQDAVSNIGSIIANRRTDGPGIFE